MMGRYGGGWSTSKRPTTPTAYTPPATGSREDATDVGWQTAPASAAQAQSGYQSWHDQQRMMYDQEKAKMPDFGEGWGADLQRQTWGQGMAQADAAWEAQHGQDAYQQYLNSQQPVQAQTPVEAPPPNPDNDLTKAGKAEDLWKSGWGSWFSDPNTSTTSFVQSHSPTDSNPLSTFAQSQMAKGAPQISNNQQSYYDQYMANRPNIAMTTDYSQYYDNAEKRAQSKLDAMGAARGEYGASTSYGMSSEMLQNMEAQKAKEEADYALKALGEDRAWWEAGGQLAGGADKQSLGIADANRQYSQMVGDLLKGGGELGVDLYGAGLKGATAADDALINKALAGFNAATATDSDQRARIGEVTGALQTAGSDYAGILKEGYGALLDDEQAWFDQQLQALMGPSSEAVNWDSQTQSRFAKDMAAVVSAIGSKGGGKSGILGAVS